MGTVTLQGEGGSAFEYDLPLDPYTEAKLKAGRMRQVEGPQVVVEAQKPAQSASKAEWVAWAVHEGVDPDEAEAMTKADLIELFGG